MEKEKIREISSLVEEYWSKHPDENSSGNKIFFQDLLLKYNLSDSDWKEVMKECNKRTKQMEKEFWFAKYILNPISTFLEYVVIIYTSIFILFSLFSVYTLPSQTLFPEGTYSEREHFVNILNIVLVVVGIYLIINKKKKN